MREENNAFIFLPNAMSFFMNLHYTPPPNQRIGYKKIGTGDIWAAITRRTIMIKRRMTGIIQILFDLVRRVRSCFIELNIMHIVANIPCFT